LPGAGRRIAAIEATEADKASIAVAEVASDTRSTIVAEANIGEIAWSPDGASIAYITGGGAQGPADLHLVAPDGTGDRVIASSGSTRVFSRIAWSPDGTRLAVMESLVDETGQTSLAIFDAIGNRDSTVGPFTMRWGLSLTWAPDGTAILVTAGSNSISFNEVPVVASLGGAHEALDVPAGYNAQCPLGWGASIP